MKLNPAQLLVTLGLAALITGCTTTTSNTGLPHGRRVVGGGLSIEWEAPERGSAILREETTRRVVATKTLDSGDSFDFPQTSDQMEALNRLFGDPMPTNLTFVLYFVPTPPPKE